jgi:alcohol dehydrogenase class IV
MRLVKEWLPKAYADGSDVEARGHMMSAAAMGAVAFQKGLGAIHALSHPVGALYDTHHGMTNAVVMPVVLRFNRPALEERIVRLAAYLGLAPSFDAFMGFVMDLRATLGVPERLRDMKGGLTATAEDFDRIAAMAVEDPTAGGNPVELTRDAARRLIEQA